MVKKTSVRKHPRKTKKGRTIVKQHKRKVTKRPQKIGSKWVGEKYVHGPRKVNPKKCSKFRVGKPINEEGQKLVFCKLKGKKNDWVVQSKLTPKNRGAILTGDLSKDIGFFYGKYEPKNYGAVEITTIRSPQQVKQIVDIIEEKERKKSRQEMADNLNKKDYREADDMDIFKDILMGFAKADKKVKDKVEEAIKVEQVYKLPTPTFKINGIELEEMTDLVTDSKGNIKGMFEGFRVEKPINDKGWKFRMDRVGSRVRNVLIDPKGNEKVIRDMEEKEFRKLKGKTMEREVMNDMFQDIQKDIRKGLGKADFKRMIRDAERHGFHELRDIHGLLKDAEDLDDFMDRMKDLGKGL